MVTYRQVSFDNNIEGPAAFMALPEGKYALGEMMLGVFMVAIHNHCEYIYTPTGSIRLMHLCSALGCKHSIDIVDSESNFCIGK